MVNFEEFFEYDPEGFIRWTKQVGQRGKPGHKAGYKTVRGYYRVQILGEGYNVHGIVWYLHHGIYPDYRKDEVIDHIDGNPSNNKIENLRLVTTSKNQQNVKVRNDNSSGVKGVHFCTRYGKWKARICLQGRRIDLGYHQTFEEAKSARLRAEMSLHPCRKDGFTDEGTTYDGTVGGKL